MIYIGDLPLPTFPTELPDRLYLHGPALHVALTRVAAARVNRKLAIECNPFRRHPIATFTLAAEAETFETHQDGRREVVVDLSEANVFSVDTSDTEDIVTNSAQCSPIEFRTEILWTEVGAGLRRCEVDANAAGGERVEGKVASTRGRFSDPRGQPTPLQGATLALAMAETRSLPSPKRALQLPRGELICRDGQLTTTASRSCAISGAP